MKRQIAWILTALLLVLSLAGCGAKSDGTAAAPQAKINGYAMQEEAGMMTADDAADAVGTAVETPRKVIITAEYRVTANRFSEAVTALEALVAQSGGYIESSDVSGENEDNGSGSYILRIPVGKLDGFAAQIGQVGTVLNRTRNERDITDQYYDVDARMKAKQAQRDRLLDMIGKAANLTELLELERELADVQGDLDSLTGTQKRYDQQVAYATVQVELWQSSLTQSGNISYGSRLGEALGGSFATALEVCKDILIALIWLLPYLIAAAVVVTVILLITRRRRRERKARSDGKKEP